MKRILFATYSAVMLFMACNKEEDSIGNNNTVTGDITKPTTWTADKTVVIDGNITVLSDLVIEPGTVIKFKQGSSLNIGYSAYGSLMAVGTPMKPILFTSNSNIPSAGDYNGINFYGNANDSSSLAYCTIEYAGYLKGHTKAALYLNHATVSLVSCIIQKSAGYGIYSHLGDFNVFSFNTIKECANYPLDIPANCAHKLDALNSISGKGVSINDGNLSGQTVTWNNLTVPYILDYLNISNNDVLTIAPGTKLHFLSGGYILVGNGSSGKLVANGTLADSIEFSSAATSPSPGDWIGIYFLDSVSDGSIIKYCNVSYGGMYGGQEANIYSQNNGSKLTISNSTVSNSSKCGISTYNCTPTIRSIHYRNNTDDECGDLVPAK